MKILVVTATAFECRFDIGFESRIGLPIKASEFLNHHVDVLTAGVGAVPTAFALTKCANEYDLIINIGIAGSYTPKYSIGEVVCVKEDTFGDYGIDDKGVFKPLSGLNFEGNSMYSSTLFMNNQWVESIFKTINLPMVKGVTLSTASGSNGVINKVKSIWNADIETMEGASVFYVCKQLNKPFICIRAISNLVEPRDKSRWEISKAIGNLDKALRQLILSLD